MSSPVAEESEKEWSLGSLSRTQSAVRGSHAILKG